MKENERENLLGWIKTAHADMEVASRLFSNEEDIYILKICCFHLQQSIEKYLKAFLILKKTDPPFTHDIALLLNLCKQFDSRFDQFDIRQINEFAVSSRYPDSMYIPDLVDIKYYFSLTRTIETFITIEINLYP